MATATSARKKKRVKTKEEISREQLLARFNKFLDYVIAAGPEFSMKTLEELEREALAAKVEEMTPKKKSELEELVFKRVEAMGKLMIDKHMTEAGLHAALDLADMLEKAAAERGMEMDFRQWVRG